MDLGTLIGILFKRWYVVVPVALLTLVSAYQVYDTVEPTFEGHGSALFLAPNVTRGEESNPFTTFDQSMETTAQAMALVTTDQTSRRELAEQGYLGGYTVVLADDSPILNITTTARRPEQALATLQGVLDLLEERLVAAQEKAGAPASQFVTLDVLTQSSKAQARFASRDRAIAAIGALGIAAMVAAALLFEALAARRQRRKEERTLKADNAAAADLAAEFEAAMAEAPGAIGDDGTLLAPTDRSDLLGEPAVPSRR